MNERPERDEHAEVLSQLADSYRLAYPIVGGILQRIADWITDSDQPELTFLLETRTWQQERADTVAWLLKQGIAGSLLTGPLIAGKHVGASDA